MDDTVFIVVHAASASVAFVAGLIAIPAGRLLDVHRGALWIAVAALVPALLVDWATTDAVLRGVFLVLLVLAAVMIFRAELAARRRPSRTGGPSHAYLDHVGFNLISLADAFAVVALIRAGVPGWLAAVLAVGIAVAGHVAVQATKRHLFGPGPAVAPLLPGAPRAL